MKGARFSGHDLRKATEVRNTPTRVKHRRTRMRIRTGLRTSAARACSTRCRRIICTQAALALCRMARASTQIMQGSRSSTRPRARSGRSRRSRTSGHSSTRTRGRRLQEQEDTPPRPTTPPHTRAMASTRTLLALACNPRSSPASTANCNLRVPHSCHQLRRRATSKN